MRLLVLQGYTLLAAVVVDCCAPRSLPLPWWAW